METQPRNLRRKAFCDLSNSKQAVMMQKSQIFQSAHRNQNKSHLKTRIRLNDTEYNFKKYKKTSVSKLLLLEIRIC